MKRDLEAYLLRWKDQKNRMPLLLRGARQVGKSYIVEKLGKNHFSNYMVLNFEQHPEYSNCFKTLDPLKILSMIELLMNVTIEIGNTLLFLDEVQECPQAIMALRYFKEQLPQLHIIAAGSLLEFVLNDEKFRMPVGRIQCLYLRPLSFGEYLDASGHNKLRNYLGTVDITNPIEDVIHQKLLALVKEYISLGGMPAVIAEYLETKNLLRCQDIQSSILLTFRNDFGKYAKKNSYSHLQTIFTKAPGLIAQWLKYTKLDPNTPAQTLKNALHKLCDAGLITLVYATSANGLPFVSHMNEKKAKLLFLDIGLVKRACLLDLELLLKEDLLLVNAGALAEQFVGQEFLAYMGKEAANHLFFWTREQKSSSAEVDYTITIGSSIIPVEVKAGSTGTLRSLKIFLKEKKSPLGVRISEKPLSLEDQILSVPLYLIEHLPRLAKS